MAEYSVVISVDHREHDAGVAEWLALQPEVRLEWRQLLVADYVIGESAAVERKRAADFVASIIDRRLFDQIERMAESFTHPILVIEGGDLYGVRRVHPNAVRGALSYVALLKGVPILCTADAEDTAALLLVMARHAQHGLGYQVPLQLKRRASSPAQRQQYVLEALPGVGPTLAQALLAHFGSVAAAMSATEDELRAVPGVGPTRACTIRAVLDRPYGKGT
jgi:Fanconi anemia group M protein